MCLLDMACHINWPLTMNFPNIFQLNSLKENGVKHVHNALSYFPASNGLVDRFVSTFKQAMKTGETQC